jgi:hypothetical protein
MLDANTALREVSNEIARMRAENSGTGRGGGPSPASIKADERDIAHIENALNQKRITLGKQLQTKRNAKNEDLDEKGLAQVQAQLDAATDSLQSTQFRKAKLYNIAAPDPGLIDSADDKEEIEAPDGSIWTKKGGVAFFTRMAGQQPAAAPGASPAPGSPAPAAAGGKMPPKGSTAQPPAPKPSGAAAATHQRAGGPPATARPRFEVGKKYSDGKRTLQWDGKQVIDVATGKPVELGK